MARVKLREALDNLDPNLTRVFLPWILRHPRYLRASASLVPAINRAWKVRREEQAKGLIVPPVLILSITSRCNLQCVGCYAGAVGITPDVDSEGKLKTLVELPREQWRKIITEASELGVFAFVIAGGEPFMFPGLIELCQEFKNRLFIIITNGLAISEDDFKRLKRSTNIAAIVSIEGDSKITDARRGKGVYGKAVKTIQRIAKSGVVTGVSVTITNLNYKYWMDPEFIDDFINMGVRIGVFTEYIPTTPEIEFGLKSRQANIPGGDNGLMLDKEERAQFRSQVLKFRDTKSIYIIHSPGDEEFFGGCVSAGRGFAHVTPGGDLTPCPVSNIATHNLSEKTLRKGLASELFKTIRENENLLETEGFPCALFAHPEEVNTLARTVGAYRTYSKRD
ncbi:MAG: radical SAM protein [Thermoplasmata archaeon]|nr:MAG: radical SAM protein [Thermoplasmata archaeon]